MIRSFGSKMKTRSLSPETKHRIRRYCDQRDTSILIIEQHSACGDILSKWLVANIMDASKNRHGPDGPQRLSFDYRNKSRRRPVSSRIITVRQ